MKKQFKTWLEYLQLSLANTEPEFSERFAAFRAGRKWQAQLKRMAKRKNARSIWLHEYMKI